MTHAEKKVTLEKKLALDATFDQMRAIGHANEMRPLMLGDLHLGDFLVKDLDRVYDMMDHIDHLNIVLVEVIHIYAPTNKDDTKRLTKPPEGGLVVGCKATLTVKGGKK